jgi:hypothetical protein
LEQLAEYLYPQKTPVGGHQLGPAEYRNRLWAYVEQHASGRDKDVVLSKLTDIGHRIDRLDELAHKGVHSDLQAVEVQRLLIGLMGLSYDLLTLAPPLAKLPNKAYEPGMEEFFRRALGREED